MISLDRRKNHKWIMQKNVSSDEIIKEFVTLIAQKRVGIDLDNVLLELERKDLYHGRNNRKSVNTMGVRLSEICFYMFGYRPSRDNFIPSPMGENIINERDNILPEENFLINLFSLQFPHPYSDTKGFNLYAGRLFVKLLLDDRIDRKLFIDEIIWFLPFIDSINSERYEELITSILEYRQLDYFRKDALFRSIKNYDDVFSNTAHEFNYYFLRIFKGLGVIRLFADPSHNNGHLFKFHHGRGTTMRNDAYDSGKKCSGYVRLSDNVVVSAEKLIAKYSPFDIPTTMETEGINSQRDWLTALYETEPLTYINCISNAVDREKEISDTIQNMVYTSKYGSRDGKEFENSLKPFMYLFRETCNVDIISGAGKTDLLCAMEDSNDSIYKMNVDAKTRKAGLEEINARRLENHLVKHGSKFCIVVAPRFASGICGDIHGHRIVTVRADDFGAYCYKECKNSKDGFADFESIHKIIQSCMGTDITEAIRELTTQRYGITI